MKQNAGMIDRLVRVSIGSLFLLAGFYWFGGTLQVVSSIVGIVVIITGLVGFCGIYSLLHISSCPMNKSKNNTKKNILILLILTLILLSTGSLASMTITRKKFLEDFNHMNGFYKQTLYLTGQSKREEAIQQYDLLVSSYNEFSHKYSSFRPLVIRYDSRFLHDMTTVQNTIDSIKDDVHSGDLVQTHTTLETIRPIFQEMFKRNGFSMISMTLVDFHDSMEQLITAADAKDPKKLLSVYLQADAALLLIEKEDSSEDIQRIRNNLNQLKSLAETGQNDLLSAQAVELKTNFIKVYLMKG